MTPDCQCLTVEEKNAEPVAAADRAAITAFRDMTPKQAARLLSLVVRQEAPSDGFTALARLLGDGRFEVTMASSWKQADVFPIIARIIGSMPRPDGGYASAHDIAVQLAQDVEARPHIEEARQQLGESHSVEWVAGNMVAWFSQRITMEESDWSRAVERVRVERQWAYRPAPTAVPG